MGQADAHLEDHKQCVQFDNVSIACSGISLSYQPSLEKEKHLNVAVRELGMLHALEMTIMFRGYWLAKCTNVLWFLGVSPTFFSSTIHLCCYMCPKDAGKWNPS